ncbi:hypothetical protein [Halococcus thailandensis]|uniref:Replication factor A n=1 Tax=Halococcus thailandensis JCM 13552 TaxID=1227457 RepID=M0ND24_9EURY|nr:hypothetical protein [Halococcus thailandensis]EMA55761.1 replication factor A [Halococcus thailandensis JCM 13552]
MSVVSQQSTSRDAQTETTSSANSGSSLVECSSIDAADEWITLETKVIELWEPTSSSVAQVGLLGDASGVTKFVSWAASDLPQLEEGASYRLENIVTNEYDEQFSVHLNTNSSIEEITGEAAERDQLPVGLPDAVAVETIDAADEWHDLVVEVDQLWKPNSDSMKQVGLVGDSTGRIKFVAWKESGLPELDEGATYRLEGVVTDEYDGQFSINLNSATDVERLDQ